MKKKNHLQCKIAQSNNNFETPSHYQTYKFKTHKQAIFIAAWKDMLSIISWQQLMILHGEGEYQFPHMSYLQIKLQKNKSTMKNLLVKNQHWKPLRKQNFNYWGETISNQWTENQNMENLMFCNKEKA